MSTESTQMTSEVPTELEQNWRYLMGGGILIALLGIFAIFTPFVTGVALSIMLGAILVVGGLIHVADAFSARGLKGSLWQLVLALVYAAAGIALLANPVVGLTTLTLLVIGYFLAGGIVEVIMGLRMRGQPRWGWIVASGVVSLLLAGLLWIDFPSSALWAVGLLFGVSLLSSGISLIGIAMTGRRATSMGEAPGAESRGA